MCAEPALSNHERRIVEAINLELKRKYDDMCGQLSAMQTVVMQLSAMQTEELA